MGDCDVTKNWALGKEFFYCKSHKVECLGGGCSDKLSRAEKAPIINTIKFVAHWPITKGFYYYVNSQGTLWGSQDGSHLDASAHDWFYASRDGKFSGYLHDPKTWKIDYS